MATTSTQGLVQALFDLVWADNIVSPEEVNAMTTILRKLGFSLAEVICLLDQNLMEPPKDREPVKLEEIFASREEQNSALEALMTVCFSTGSIDPEQMGYIEGLIVRMGLSVAELEELRKQVVASAG